MVNCISCEKELNALNMSDADESYCGSCANALIDKLLLDCRENELILFHHSH